LQVFDRISESRKGETCFVTYDSIGLGCHSGVEVKASRGLGFRLATLTFTRSWGVDAASTFRIAEYNALRSELLYQIAEIDKIKFWIAAAIAFYYSFITAKFLVVRGTRTMLTGPVLIWAAPIVLPILGMLRLRAEIGQLTIFSDYIKKIEEQFPTLEGWEHFYRAQQSNDTVWNNDYLYFGILAGVCVAILVLRWTSHVPEEEPAALT
jgi:hypothetical protein